jgi:hypothetical protein
MLDRAWLVQWPIFGQLDLGKRSKLACAGMGNILVEFTIIEYPFFHRDTFIYLSLLLFTLFIPPTA